MYSQFADYLAHSDRCLEAQWLEYVDDAINKRNNLALMSQFFATVGNNHYMDINRTYSNLSFPIAAYGKYVTTINSTALGIPGYLTNINVALVNANSSYMQVTEQTILIVNALMGALSSSKVNGLLKMKGCDWLYMPKFFELIDLIVSCRSGCTNQFVNLGKIETNLLDAISTWFSLYNQFKVCAMKTNNFEANICYTNVSDGSLSLPLKFAWKFLSLLDSLGVYGKCKRNS